MKRFKKALHRIQAKASAKRERLRGKSAAKRELNKVTTSEVQASEVLYESAQTENAGLEVPGPADSAIPSEPDQVVDLVPTSKVSYMYSDTALFYISSFAEGNFVERLWLQFGTWESFENRFVAKLRSYHPDYIPANRRSPCPLDWLPLEIRAKIWKYVFDDCNEAIIIGNDKITPKIPSSLRFLSFDWMSEMSIAYINALSNRTLVVMDFPRHGYLTHTCPIFRELSMNRIRAIKFTLGDNEIEKARKRTYDFIKFMLKHKNYGFMTVRTVIVELRRNWENEFFTESDLAYMLVSGAFVAVERVRIHGHITDEKLNRVLERTRKLAQTSYIAQDLQIAQDSQVAEDWQFAEGSQFAEYWRVAEGSQVAEASF